MRSGSFPPVPKWTILRQFLAQVVVMTAKPARIGNLGPKTSAWLNDIGIYTLEDIEALGVVEVYKRLKEANPHRVSLNALYGLQAAVLGTSWLALSPDMKEELKTQAGE
jgi:DNA transformation protein